MSLPAILTSAAASTNVDALQQHKDPPNIATLTGADGTTLLSPETQMAFADALDDVHTRFVINLPPEELATSDRIFFQLEQAWWFYEDFICDNQPADEAVLPRFKNVRPFCHKMFQYSPLFQGKDFNVMWLEFSNYKRTISTYGTILLNEDCSKVLLTSTYDKQAWTLPAGKINQGEQGYEAAARETYEETGFDPLAQHGVAKLWREKYELLLEQGDAPSPLTWSTTLRSQDALSYMEPNGKRRTCYICKGVPEEFPFEPVARKEVGDVEWFPIDQLPKKTFAVLPFFGRLRGWIRKQQRMEKKKNNRSKSSGRDKSNSRSKSGGRNKSAGRDKSNGRDKSTGREKSSGRKGRPGSTSRRGSNGRMVQADDPLINAGLAKAGQINRWTEEEMFQTNEKILGRKVEYDGNPHVFAEQGFCGNDPHAFRVVGGSFMNSDGKAPKMSSKDGGILDALMGGNTMAPTNSHKPSYQPLVATNTVSQLTPFFSEDGETPWGEVVKEAAPSEPMPTEKAGEALLSMLQSGGTKNADTAAKLDSAMPRSQEIEYDALDALTDAQITARNQQRHNAEMTPSKKTPTKKALSKKMTNKQRKYEEDTQFIEEWVQKLPRPFDIRVSNVDAIIADSFGARY